MMGGCLARHKFTVNEKVPPDSIRTYPIVFSMTDSEIVLNDFDPGTYLLFRDIDSDYIYLSIRLPTSVRHHRIREVDSLFYLDKQPYPYLDSILLYHRKRPLRGVVLRQQANLSARVVKAFMMKVTASNGNVKINKATPPSDRPSRYGSTESLITTSSSGTS